MIKLFFSNGIKTNTMTYKVIQGCRRSPTERNQTGINRIIKSLVLILLADTFVTKHVLPDTLCFDTSNVFYITLF